MVKIPRISVVLGSYNRISFLKLTIKTIRDELINFDHEIIVIDGGSSDGSDKWLIKQKDIITIIQHNRGFWERKKIERKSWGYFMNLGFKIAKGKYICMVSDDCLIIPGAIKNGYDLFEKKLEAGDKIGAMAFYFRDWSEKRMYHVVKTIGQKIYLNYGLYSKEALEKVNYLDEDTYTFYYSDADVCLKMYQNGFKCIDSPNSFIEHYSHANRAVRESNYEKVKSDRNNYLLKWKNTLPDDVKNYSGDTFEVKDFHDTRETYKLFFYLHKISEFKYNFNTKILNLLKFLFFFNGLKKVYKYFIPM